jgi:hypothetical protein
MQIVITVLAAVRILSIVITSFIKVDDSFMYVYDVPNTLEDTYNIRDPQQLWTEFKCGAISGAFFSKFTKFKCQ